MNITGKHIAVLVDNHFEQSEFEEPISAIKDAGGEVTVISTDKVDLTGMKHAELGDSFKADLLITQASSDDYDALVLPGGAINADSLRVNETAQSWVIDFLDSGRPLAAICHAPWLLVSTDVVEGRRLTSFHTIKDDITNAGGEWVNLPVVVDDNLITSRQPDDLPPFNGALITMLSRQESRIIDDEEEMVGDNEKDTEENNRLSSLGYDKSRDQISLADEEEILDAEDESDTEELHLSSIVSEDEQDGA